MESILAEEVELIKHIELIPTKTHLVDPYQMKSLDIELIKHIESIYPSSLGHQHMVFCIAILKQKAHHNN